MQAPFRILERRPEEAFAAYLRKNQLKLPRDYAEQAFQLIAQAIMDSQVSAMIEASRYERNPIRRAYRNGYRDSAWLTEKGSIPLRIPKLRSGTYYPSFLEEAHAEAEISRLALKAYLDGATYEDVADTLDNLGIEAHASEIAALHEQLYDLGQTYRERLVTKRRVTLDLLSVDDEGKRRYLAIAASEGEVLDHEITPDADDRFWQDFIRRIDQRSVHGVEYVAIGQIRHIVRLSHNKPEMALAA
jgi:putative transposase